MYIQFNWDPLPFVKMPKGVVTSTRKNGQASTRTAKSKSPEDALNSAARSEVNKCKRSAQNRGLTLLKKFCEFCAIVDANAFLSIQLDDENYSTHATFTTHATRDWRTHAKEISEKEGTEDVVLHIDPCQYRKIWVDGPKGSMDEDLVRQLRLVHKPWFWDGDTKARLAPQLIDGARERRAIVATAARPLEHAVEGHFGDVATAVTQVEEFQDAVSWRGDEASLAYTTTAAPGEPEAEPEDVSEPVVPPGVLKYLQRSVFDVVMDFSRVSSTL